MLLILILGLLQVVGTTGNDLIKKSKSQARYYISNIENGSDLEANVWALTTLASENAEIRSYIENKVQDGNYNEPLHLFKRIEPKYKDQLKRVVFETGSSNLLVDLLLNTKSKEKKKNLYRRFQSQFDHSQSGGIDYYALCRSIIEENPLENKDLSYDSFLLPHFFILYRNYKLIPNDYLEKIIANWVKQGQSSSKLYSSLFNASYLRALYLGYKYGETSSLYNSLIDDTKFPNSNLKLRIYRYLDYSMYRLGYYDRSLKIVRNFTLPLATFLKKENEIINLKQLQGVYLYNIGKIKTAENIYQEVLTEIKQKNLNTSLSSLYNNLALAYHKLGKYDNYLDLQFRALATAKENNNYNHQLDILNNLFIYYRESNNPQIALEYLKKAQLLAQNFNKTSDLGTIYMSFGSFYRKFEGNFEKAHLYYAKSADILNSADNLRRFIQLLNEQAESYLSQNKHKLALKKHDKILELTNKEKGGNYLDALVNKALINLKIGNVEKSEELITKFKSFDLNKLDFDKLIKAKTVEADYLARIGNTKQAVNILVPALDQVVVRAKSSTDLKSGFWHVENEYLDAFELAVSIYKGNGQPGKAIEKLDQLKTINDASFYQNPLVKSSLLNESELTQFKKLTQQLDATRKKLLTASEDEQFSIRQTISRLKLKKRKLDRKLTKDIDSDPISIREVQNKLSAHELVMHITELKNQYYFAQISRSDVKINTIPLDSKLRNLLAGSAQRVATHKTNLDSLYKISRILKLKEIPNHIEQITIIPDSYFYQLPLDILPLEKPDKSYSYGEVKYVIENFRTQYLTSLGHFRSDSDSELATQQNSLNYVGYGVSNFSRYNKKSLVPLPFAQTEVTSIANKLTQLPKVQTYINEQSTKSSFTQTAPKASVIHLATHSEVSERDPMFSTVYLSKINNSPDSTFDDQIFAYELFELNLSNEMIMLNSCESGSGSYIQGTGVMGISRALQYAGAKSLVLNLWSVNDMLASDFAIYFYDQLNQGKSKAEALRNTKRYFLRTKNASPHFWGPYMLIGNTDPIVEPNQTENLAMAGVFIFYFLLMVGLSYLTQQGIILQNKKDNAA